MIKCVTFDSGWAQWCRCWCWLLWEWRFLCQLTPSLSSEFECATARDVWHRGTYSKCWHGGRGKIRFALFLGSFLFGSDEGRVDCVYFYTVYRNTGYYCRNAQRTHNKTWFQSYKELTIHRSLYLLCLLCTSWRFVSSVLPHPSHNSDPPEWNGPDQTRSTSKFVYFFSAHCTFPLPS